MCKPGPEEASSAAATGEPPTPTNATKEMPTPAVPDADAEYFGGEVKSYNERRGFGFLACEETALRFGRDVYLSKVEAQVSIEPDEEPLKEGDFAQFAVQLSTEGFPQAIGVQRLQRFTGTVLHFRAGVGGAIACETAAELFGNGEVLLKPDDCGQLLLCPGDLVNFCVTVPKDAGAPEAGLVQLVSTSRSLNAMLGCFSLEFPRPVPNAIGQSVPEGEVEVKPVYLDGHAFSARICLARVPVDMHDAELMKFFGKHGASSCTVAHADGRGFACVQFNDPDDVAKLLSRGALAFTDGAATLLARLVPSAAQRGCATYPVLPALGAPTLLEGESGTLVVGWAPLSIAGAYKVDIRIAGANSWSAVDSSGNVQPAGSSPLLGVESNCLSVTGLSIGVPYEARVGYMTSCGCMAEPSDASPPCIIGWGHVAAPEPIMETTSIANQFAAPQTPLGVTSIATPTHPSVGQVCPPPPTTDSVTRLQPGAFTAGSTCHYCPHGCPLQPPHGVIETRIVDELGTSLSMIWHGVNHVVAGFAIEIRENGNASGERFTRPAPAQTGGTLELTVGGLLPGRCYFASVRCILPCGCESEACEPALVMTPQPQPQHLLAPTTTPGTPVHGTPVHGQHATPVQAHHQSVAAMDTGAAVHAPTSPNLGLSASAVPFVPPTAADAHVMTNGAAPWTPTVAVDGDGVSPYAAHMTDVNHVMAWSPYKDGGHGGIVSPKVTLPHEMLVLN